MHIQWKSFSNNDAGTAVIPSWQYDTCVQCSGKLADLTETLPHWQSSLLANVLLLLLDVNKEDCLQWEKMWNQSYWDY